MVTTIDIDRNIDILFPCSDGKPMADNTEQYEWIVKIKENLEILFAHISTVFIAGDLLWYPVKSTFIKPIAPDIMVAFDRPKGYRKSYRQWEEDNIPPQVVFEIIFPGNKKAEMIRKFEFYQNYGVEEYYIYDPRPRKRKLQGWIRGGNQLIEIVQMSGWVSPRLQIRFEMENRELKIYYPSGEKFLTSVELAQKVQESELKAQKLAQKLRELGINPDKL